MQLVVWIFSVLIVVGFLLNAIAILMFLKNRKLLTVSDLPILSIAIADCFLSVFVMPFGAAANARDTWPYGSGGCTWYACLNTIVGLGTMLHHTVIAVEKCLKTHRPMTAHVTHKKMLIVIALVWGFASLWGIFPLIGWSSYGPEGTGASCSIKWQSDEFVDASFIICTFVIFFISPSVVVVASYTTIYNDLQQMTEKAKRQWGKEVQQTRGIMLALKKVTFTAFILIASFFVV
ncbi:hypothetical protein OS493_015388 [Desmophyllum pertusum]|uniref:G-protein coupled receptors family 1 profile domain-containing protein n=1 Tax=Desmophyllum pertusum TaxID=174260 RepID=A0A9W9Z0I4_9CNID|nr:hypothetical protein OS493_015388 [Desmophyllum pertusum]